MLIDERIDGARVIAPNDIWRSILFMRADTTEAFKMPPLARNTIDERGMALSAQWIESLPGPPVLPPPEISPRGGNYSQPVEVVLKAEPGAKIYYTLDGTVPTTSDLPYEKPILGRPDDFARESVQARLHQEHHRAGNFSGRQLIYFLRTTSTPHGLPGDLTRAISFSVARSTTETSSDGPFAEKRNFPSGEIAMPHGRVPTLIVFNTS